MEDKLKITGRVKIEALYGDRAEVLYEGDNAVVNTGRQILVTLLASGDGDAVIDRVGWGVGTAPVVPTDEGLTSPVFSNIQSYTNPAFNQVRFVSVLDNTQGNGTTISELGLFAVDDTLFARFLPASPVAKTNAISLRATWTITIN